MRQKNHTTSPLTPQARVIWAIVNDAGFLNRHVYHEWVIFSSLSQAVELAKSEGIKYCVAEVWIDRIILESWNHLDEKILMDEKILRKYFKSLKIDPITSLESFQQLKRKLDQEVLPKLRMLGPDGKIARGPIPRPAFVPMDPEIEFSQPPRLDDQQRRTLLIEFLGPKFESDKPLVLQAQMLTSLINKGSSLGIEVTVPEIEGILKTFCPQQPNPAEAEKQPLKRGRQTQLRDERNRRMRKIKQEKS